MPQDVNGMETLLQVRPEHGSGFENQLTLEGLGADAVGGAGAARFADKLLVALVSMAVRSKRRQADLCAAMARAGLRAERSEMDEALHELQGNGMIENIVPLYDGGVLLSVTSRGIERRTGGQRWAMLGGDVVLR
jgi:hypothetical protein